MDKNCFDYIICGGGASGLLLAQQLIADPFFSDKDILLIEKENKNQNDRTWCFWEPKGGKFDALLYHKWELGNFKSNDFAFDFDFNPLEYKMLRSASFYKKIYGQLEDAKNWTLIRKNIVDIESKLDGVTVHVEGQAFEAKKGFSSLLKPKLLTQQKKYPVLRQHFLGWFVETEVNCFESNRITFMDFSIPQKGNTRFLYVLPFDSKRALIEYTLFSGEILNKEAYEEGIKSYLSDLGIFNYKIIEKEQGMIPMCSYPLHQQNTEHLIHIGTAGGWTKASTGYTFKNTEIKTLDLVTFLKTNRSFKKFQKTNRFWIYDLLFLDVLDKHNAYGSRLFSRLFEKIKPNLIFRFLSEQTSIREELKIMSSFRPNQIWFFIVAALKRLF